MKKRLISLLVAAIMICSLANLSFAAVSDFEWLNSSGLMSSEFASYSDTDPITRGTFAKVIVTIMGMENMLVSDTEVFTDVDKSTPCYKEIATLSALKIMSGYQDGSFRPNKELLNAEAVKIMINLLGYKYKAEANGGYPGGYMAAASELKLLSGVKGSYSDVITFKNLITLIMNSIDIPIAEISGTGENYNITIDKNNTILSKYHNMAKETGKVTATTNAALAGYYKAAEGKLRIDGTDYFCTVPNTLDFIGLTVDYIYKTDDASGDKTIVKLEPVENNKTVEFSLRDYLSVNGNTISYSENDRTKVINFTADADIIYNGENYTKGDKSLNELISGTTSEPVTESTVKLVSTKRNSTYDLVIIKSFTDMVAGKIDDIKKIIYDTDNPLKSINLDDTTKTVNIYDEKGNNANFKFISTNDVLTVMDNDNCCTVYVCANTESGILSSVTSESDGIYFILGDKSIKLTSQCEATYTRYNAGENIRIQLNCFGDAARITTLSKDGFEFAYLAKIGSKVSGPDENVSGKFFNQSRGLCTLSFDSQVIIDGVKLKDITVNKLTAALGGNVQKLVGIKVDETSGKVYELETPKSITQLKADKQDGFCQTHQLAERKYADDPPHLSRTIMLTKTTPIMQIPADADNSDDKTFCMINAGSFTKGDTINCEAYNSSVNYGIPDFIVYRPVTGASSAPALVYESPLAVIKDKSIAVNEEGMSVIRYKVQKGTTEDFFYIDDTQIPKVVYDSSTTYSADKLEKGDIIRFSVDNEHYIRIMEMMYDYSQKKWVGSGEYALGIAKTTGMVMSTVDEIVGTYVYVPYWWPGGTDYYGVVDLSEKTLSIGGVSIIQSRDSGEPIVSAGSTSDVSKYDNVIIHLAYGQLIGIVILR